MQEQLVTMTETPSNNCNQVSASGQTCLKQSSTSSPLLTIPPMQQTATPSSQPASSMPQEMPSPLCTQLPPQPLPPEPPPTIPYAPTPPSTPLAALAEPQSLAPQPPTVTVTVARSIDSYLEEPHSSNEPSHEELGIIMDKPKRYEYADSGQRLNSFQDWPADRPHKEDMADAGFFYTGYNDCARCFFCGGGLSDWHKNDNPWVEHSKFLRKCPFVRIMKGQKFVDTVQCLRKGQDNITYTDVIEAMRRNGVDPEDIPYEEHPLAQNAAVQVMKRMGVPEEDILEAASDLRNGGKALSTDAIITALLDKGVPERNLTGEAQGLSCQPQQDSADLELGLAQLREEANRLKERRTCKLCRDKIVSATFLPCGHLVTCLDCCMAQQFCPQCKKEIHAFIKSKIWASVEESQST